MDFSVQGLLESIKATFRSNSPAEVIQICPYAVEGNPLRGPYSSQDEAAQRALQYSNPLSIRDNLEYGGLIYRDASGHYWFSGPVKGADAGVNPHAAGAPLTAKVMGDYHTHSDYSTMDLTTRKAIRVSDPKLDVYDSDNFSPSDYKGIKADSKGSATYRGYLGTPSGIFKFYEPSTGKEGVL